MILQMLLAIKTFAALGACVQRMVDVLGLVLFQLVLAGKGHFAVITLEGPYVGVTRERVSLQVKRCLESFSALVTSLVLYRIVLAHMFRKVGPSFIGLTAHLAYEKLQIAGIVSGQVVVERVARRKLLVACGANVLGFICAIVLRNLLFYDKLVIVKSRNVVID